jgi:large conductance mechanosensitive channel
LNKFLEEFKAFSLHGNVLDLAIGVIIGTAFNKIVTSLVVNIITPLLGIFLGRVNIEDLSVTFNTRILDMPAITLKYGIFLQSVLDFLIVALSIFLMIKLISKLPKKKTIEAEQTEKTENILAEIRDILKEQNKKRSTAE